MMNSIGALKRIGFTLLHRIASPSFLAALGVLIVTGWALFIPPYIGMADNGDYFRILYPNGLFFHLPDYDSRYFGYFVRTYGIFQYYNENSAMVFTSQSLFIRAALALNKLLYSGEVFDLRFQAAIFTVLYTVGIYLLVEGLTYKVSRRRGWIIAALAVFIFGDTAYTAYFQSFFGESVMLVALIFVAASWLLLCRRRFNDYVMLGLFVASALLLTTSKQQNAPVGILLAILGLSLLFLRRGRPYRPLVMLSLVGLFVAGVGTYVLIPQEFVHINQYHAMTRGVLLGSTDPEETLRSFDINEQYAILKDSIYYEQYSTVDVDSPLLERDFYSQYGFGSVLGYYLSHPDKLGNLLNVAAKQAFSIRPAAMGNYEMSAGKGFGTQTRFFSAYSLIKKQGAPKTFGFIALWAVLNLGLHLPGFVQAWKKRDFRQMQKLFLIVALLLAGFSGILVSIIGAGDADLSKHEFLFTLAFDLVTFITVADAISRQLLRPGRSTVEAAGVSPEASPKGGETT
ncbi:glycan biosynthesis hexose transferase WsfD [Gorillibacterium timonense]|uniref:glycan biosynthesis hexose transferase WsfD n=1 Tax=Gorillibacterium timonense TaxID=1689269 RepID=UPI00071D5712|nr:hypothetical protein [Gorillibacterium timonense]